MGQAGLAHSRGHGEPHERFGSGFRAKHQGKILTTLAFPSRALLICAQNIRSDSFFSSCFEVHMSCLSGIQFLFQERKEAIERTKQREAESESIKTEKNAEIEKNVRAWSLDKQRAGRELSFPELLRDLAFILPPDLLLVVYDSQHKVILDALQEFSVNSPPTEVWKRMQCFCVCLFCRHSCIPAKSLFTVLTILNCFICSG